MAGDVAILKEDGLRVPPTNEAAERALLGAILLNNGAYDKVSDFLEPKHFTQAVNAEIYRAIIRRIEKGDTADVITLRAELQNSPAFEDVGGYKEYVNLLLVSFPGIINAADYGHAIHDAWIRRELIDIGEDVVNDAFGQGEGATGEEQIEIAEEKLFRLSNEKGKEGDFKFFNTALKEALSSAEQAFHNEGHITGLTSGLRDLDEKTGGLHPSDLIILAGRPGMGKTALATKMAFSAAQALKDEDKNKKGCVAIFSLEMSAEQLALRILSERSEISGEDIRRGHLTQEKFDRFYVAAQEMSNLPIVIDDTPALPLSALRTRCRRLKHSQGLSLIVIDYLQLMRPSMQMRTENRVLEISMITQGLKALAKEMNVPVIALSQLSRQVENREDKRPQLSDLRESGSIEQDADSVMFIYRDEYYLKQREPREASFTNSEKFHEVHDEWKEKMGKVSNKAELLLEKQRHGPTGYIELYFNGEYTRFSDLDTHHDG